MLLVGMVMVMDVLVKAFMQTEKKSIRFTVTEEKQFDSPFEDRVALQGGERHRQCIEAQHHPEVVTYHHSTPEGCMEGHLSLALMKEAFNLVFRDGSLVVEEEHLIGEDYAVEVRPVAAAHVPPDGDVPGPDVPPGSSSQARRTEREVHVEHLAPVYRHFEVVNESPVGLGLSHDLYAGLPGTPGDGCGVLLHGEDGPTPRKLHDEHVHRCKEVH
jgi:hypothetical protein